MAIVVESSATDTSWGLANPAVSTISKPSGLAVGDLMVAIMVLNVSAIADACDTPSGWTKIRSDGAGSPAGKMTSFYKVADSSDVAASSFGFTATGSGNARLGGIIMRISGQAGTGYIDSSTGVGTSVISNDSTPNYGITVTPTIANSLLIYPIFGCASTSSFTVTSRAVTTSNPSWTELIDNSTMSFSVAHATRPETTATTDATAVLSVGDNSEDSFAQLIVIKPKVDINVSVSNVQITNSVKAPTVQVGINLTPSVVSVTVAVQTPTPEMLTRWNTETKNTSTWTNQDKTP